MPISRVRTCVWPIPYLSETTMPKAQWVIIEVGETTEKRSQLANKIVASVILPQFIIIPLAVMLVWFGLSRGLRPLTRLRKTIDAREPDDLSPIATRRVPGEAGATGRGLQRNAGPHAAQRRSTATFCRRCRPPDADAADRPENPGPIRHP